MSEMVERVAKAILRVNVPEADWNYCKSIADHPLYTSSIELARAALIEVQEPTESMIEAGRYADNGEDMNIGSTAARGVWLLMVEATLK